MDTSHLPVNMLDRAGRILPAYMTDGEIAAELAGQTDRRDLLDGEATTRSASRRRARAAAVRTAQRYSSPGPVSSGAASRSVNQ